MTLPNGTGRDIPLMKIGGALVVLIPIIIAIGTLIYRSGNQSTQVEHNTMTARENKNLTGTVDKLSDALGIAETKITDNTESIDKLFITNNLMRQEIQRNAENKLERNDFFRIESDLNERLLYLERQQFNVNNRPEVTQP